jgi:hypothetical protein
MDHLIDYIQWMADVPFTAYPLQDADALVLSFLSYYELTPLFEGGEKPVYLKDSLKLLEDGDLRAMLVGRDRGFRAILEAAASSRRFGELRLSDYVDLRRAEPPLQFAALTFHGEDFSFLAFRGTDGSIAGWKEDFMISFTVTEAQKLARDYARRIIIEDRGYYIGGHSKGGNLALYASCMLSEKKWDKVVRVFLLDGPGFCPDVLSTDKYERVDARTRRFIPRFSVVGKLFEPQMSDTRIVRSSARGFMQHNLESWQIEYGKPALEEENDSTCIWIHDTLDSWIKDLNQEERISLIDDLFDTLAAGGAETLNELNLEGKEGREAILRRLHEMSESTKDSLAELPKYAFRARLNSLREKISEDISFLGMELLGAARRKAEQGAADEQAVPNEGTEAPKQPEAAEQRETVETFV